MLSNKRYVKNIEDFLKEIPKVEEEVEQLEEI
jgi:hypothetical protein